ncbi:MAG: glycosyltransferase family 88 protein [Legionella sp.]|nr:glycosyltransferase family 88 protein [Legionella sp.]
MSYKYNPHQHVKIWLSNNPDIFINLENQIRLIQMREKNLNDVIHLIYDATLLSPTALAQLNVFCSENRIIPVNADSFKNLLKSDLEHQLFSFYQDEIQHLSEGGNLAVGSDILRWLSPVYSLGTYTDFDFPIDTSHLPALMEVKSPLLLNIGSLKMGKKEFIFANNDYVAIIDEVAASEHIINVQRGIIDKLTCYQTDFMEKTRNDLGSGFINRQLFKLMENRSEPAYITKSNEINKERNSSRNFRNYIRQIMSDKTRFLIFNRKSEIETEAMIIKRLKDELQKQLNVIKYCFFSKEYAEIKQIVRQNDKVVLNYLMKKELNLYLKSIIVCTTGPIEIVNALFGAYVLNSKLFIQKIQPFSFNTYNLKKAFQSLNSIPLHENSFGMLRFLGVGEGEINDSSWLDSGRQLQEMRVKKLAVQQEELASNLPESFLQIKQEMEAHLNKQLNTPYQVLFKTQEQTKLLQELLQCFKQEENEFDAAEFKTVLLSTNLRQGSILSRLFFRKTKRLINDLESLSHRAILFSLTENRKVKLNTV